MLTVDEARDRGQRRTLNEPGIVYKKTGLNYLGRCWLGGTESCDRRDSDNI